MLVVKDENLALFELVAVFATASLFYLVSLPTFLAVSLAIWLGYLIITIGVVNSQQRQGFLQKIYARLENTISFIQCHIAIYFV